MLHCLLEGLVPSSCKVCRTADVGSQISSDCNPIQLGMQSEDMDGGYKLQVAMIIAYYVMQCSIPSQYVQTKVIM